MLDAVLVPDLSVGPAAGARVGRLLHSFGALEKSVLQHVLS